MLASTLSPHQIIRAGVFGGSYWSRASEKDFDMLAPDLEALARTQVGIYDAKVNFYKKVAGLSFGEWTANGWIFPEDPLGWFQWYCRYHSGRRHPRDDHQIYRTNNYVVRWGRLARFRIKERGFCSTVIKQGLLQWGHDPIAMGIDNISPSDSFSFSFV